ncbi:DNA polymerase III delta prime subunit [Olavius algarvensis spirochete endosymbiont]|uniref:hypothetical protein n=1 Tax=Olavius algarvensis spirochete endosymbiont TaxID=260710 RepID=UPI000F2D2E19|nr:hypothetical protein [Olavius algarvensis spirochete endosymbiont]VDA99143.1 DNA polymerase III delta prime subunit [Olavius algarvensis spirochete endosymbiont]
MFENLLYQEGIVDQLKQEIIGDSLAPALLFSGPPLSGKLTAALELARILCCESSKGWSCACKQCRVHRLLAHPRTILMGQRNLIPEISACAELIRHNKSYAASYLMIRSVRKLLRRFDLILRERKLAKLHSIAERLAESVESILPRNQLPEGEVTLLNSLVDDCIEMQKALPELLPIAQIRHVRHWAHHSSAKNHKTIIIDNATRMPDASKNALLKFLEEPPVDTSIILITDCKQILLPTIASRLRHYPFKTRSRAQEAEILRRVFKKEGGGGLQDFFDTWRRGSSNMAVARQFIVQANSNNRAMPREVLEIRDLEDLRVFLEALSAELRDRWKKTASPKHRRFLAEQNWIRDARFRAENLNLPIPLVLRGLYYSMGGF